MSDFVYVWKVQDGPYSVDEDLDYQEEYPEGYSHWLVVMTTDKLETKGFTEDELWFTSFADAYKFKKEVDESFEPVRLPNG